MDSKDVLDRSIILKELNNSNQNYTIEIFDEIDSTNIYAKTVAEKGTTNNFAVIADRQTKGKGRLGRSFLSPAGRGLYFSIICKPDIKSEDYTLLTVAAASATATAIDKLAKCKTQIKWVNDILIDGKKVCGILAESGIDTKSQSISYSVVGIGVNVTGSIFPAEIESIASSIEKSTGVVVSRNLLFSEILNNFTEFCNNLSEREYLKIYKEKSVVLGKKVNVIQAGSSYEAEAVEIDDNGNLIVLKDGVKQKIFFGEVSVKL